MCLHGGDKLNDFRLQEIAQSASWLSPPETPETLLLDRAVMGKVYLADTIAEEEYPMCVLLDGLKMWLEIEDYRYKFSYILVKPLSNH